MAKRNKQKAKQMRSGKSPYARHHKAECYYSADYYAWFQENHASGQRHRLDTRGRGSPAKAKDIRPKGPVVRLPPISARVSAYA